MNTALSRNIGGFIKSVASGAVDVVAAGAGDASEDSGAWIDRQGYLSGKLVISYEAVLAATETLSIAANIQDATDSSGTGAADFGTAFANAVVATGQAGGSTERGTVEIDVDLNLANQYLRSQVTPDLSASATDTAIITATFILGGAQELPPA